MLSWPCNMNVCDDSLLNICVNFILFYSLFCWWASRLAWIFCEQSSNKYRCASVSVERCKVLRVDVWECYGYIMWHVSTKVYFMPVTIHNMLKSQWVERLGPRAEFCKINLLNLFLVNCLLHFYAYSHRHWRCFQLQSKKYFFVVIISRGAKRRRLTAWP